MVIRYVLTAADLRAAAGYLRARSGQKLPWLYWIIGGLLLILLVLVAIAVLRELSPLYMGPICFFIYYLFWPAIKHFLDQQKDPRPAPPPTISQTREAFPERTLYLLPDELKEVSPWGTIHIPWSAIKAIHVTPARAFIATQTPALLITIPKKGVTAGNYEGFVKACQARQLQAAGL